MWALANLHHRADHFYACGFDQPLQLVQSMLFKDGTLGIHNANQDGPLLLNIQLLAFWFSQELRCLRKSESLQPTTLLSAYLAESIKPDEPSDLTNSSLAARALDHQYRR